MFVLETPGGLVDSTRTIVTRMLAAKTPVAVFVAPSGARAASAGFLITIAADIAAMAPGTHIGAAHPVSGQGEKMDETMVEEGRLRRGGLRADAGVRARPQRRVGRAGRATRAARSPSRRPCTATPPLIDLVAADVPDLLPQLDGREITRFDGTHRDAAHGRAPGSSRST